MGAGILVLSAWDLLSGFFLTINFALPLPATPFPPDFIVYKLEAQHPPSTLGYQKRRDTVFLLTFQSSLYSARELCGAGQGEREKGRERGGESQRGREGGGGGKTGRALLITEVFSNLMFKFKFYSML